MEYNRTDEGIELVFDNGSKMKSKTMESFLLYEIFVVLSSMFKVQMTSYQAKGDKPNA